MPEYLSPGVYVEEVNSGPRPIEGVGTAMAAFVGFAAAGPINHPELITNWSQYVGAFGALEEGGRRNPHMKDAYLSHAVYGYFQNGGGRCYVTRIGGSADNNGNSMIALHIPSKRSKAIASFTVEPKDAKANIAVEIAPSTGDELSDNTFTMRVRLDEKEEVYDNLTVSRGAKNVVETVNQASELIIVTEAKATGSRAEHTPQTGTYLLKNGETSLLPQVKPPSFEGNVAERSGIQGLQIAEDATMVCCPDIMAAYKKGMIDKDGVKSVQTALISHCEHMGDRLAILDPLPELNAKEAGDWRNEANYDSKFAALYYPWITISGPDGSPIDIPPSGHIAGIYARSDHERGVHKAPANEVVRGALKGVIPITKGEQDTLNPIGVNCIRSFTGHGLRVWGARTLSSDPAWRYIPVRRLFNFVEKSIERGTQWVVFEPNDQDLWARVRRDVGSFLLGVHRSGALFGNTPAEAFFVKCDEELNPPDVRDRGELVIEVGLAPVKPAEFVIFRLSQFSGLIP